MLLIISLSDFILFILIFPFTYIVLGKVCHRKELVLPIIRFVFHRGKHIWRKQLSPTYSSFFHHIPQGHDVFFFTFLK